MTSCASFLKEKPLINPDDAQRPFLGIEFFSELVEVLPSSPDFSKGVLLKFVFPGSPGEKSGLKTDDVILAINQKNISQFGFKSGLDFTEFFAAQKIGTVMNFTIFRSGNLVEISLLLVGRKYSFGESYSKSPVFELKGYDKKPNFDFQKLIRQYQAEQEVDDLQKRFLLMTDEGDPLRHPAVISLQKNAFNVFPYSYWVKDQLDIKAKNTLLNSADFLLNYMAVKPQKTKQAENPSALDILALFQKAHNEMNLAYSNLVPLEKEFLKANLPLLAKTFSEQLYIHEVSHKMSLETNLKTISLVKKIKPVHLLQAYSQFAQLIDLKFLADLKTTAERYLNKSGQPLTRISSSFGSIIIAGAGDNLHTYAVKDNIFLIIDLGGDDRYLNVDSSVIDFGGNDSYESSAEWTTAGSILDLRFLIDSAGDDQYVGLTGSYAASLFGISFLWDLDGSDTYRCVKYCFGTGFGGVAVLADENGHDRYEGLLMSQGLGIAGGFGLLLDLQGNDQYYSKGLKPSGYGDAGQFDGWSQGVGLGLRGFISGGLGLLYDRAGEDHFNSGDFSQGGGYYFGWGLLINSGSDNDTYTASHYSQGFTAHYAIGSLLDQGGNDRYISKHEVGQGMSWDLGITLFEDFAGDDIYKTCEYCLGSASQSGFTFFLDDDGRDTYQGAKLPSASPIGNAYHSGVSLGYFIDRGQKEDRYEKFKNNSQAVRLKYQFLIDE